MYLLSIQRQLWDEKRLLVSPVIGFSSILVLNELQPVSSGSKSHLISGGDSSYSWVFICVLDLWGGRSCWLYYWVGSWWHAPVSSMKKTNTQLGYSLYWLLLRLVDEIHSGEVTQMLQQSSIILNTCSNTTSAIVSQVGGGLQFVTKLYSYTAKMLTILTAKRNSVR